MTPLAAPAHPSSFLDDGASAADSRDTHVFDEGSLDPDSFDADLVDTGLFDAGALDLTDDALDAVRLLDSSDPAAADEAALVELVAGWERISTWVAARQAEALAELDRRHRSSSTGAEYVADAVAARLTLTMHAARVKIDHALGLAQDPEVREAMVRGVLDTRRAHLLLDETGHLSAGARAQVLAAVLPGARDLTTSRLRAAVRWAEAGLEDETAHTRREHARADRCVRVTPAADTMAWLTAYLPAEDAAVVMTALDGLGTRQSPEDERTTDQRRADALADVMRSVLDDGHGPDGTPVGVRQHRHPHISLTMTPGTALGLTNQPAHLDGYGPLPAEVARRIAADGAWRGVLTDPLTGSVVARGTKAYRPGPALVALVAGRDVTCTFPGCRVPAHRCDIDHVEPYRPVESAVDPPGPAGVGVERQTRADNLQALCRHHHRLKTHGGWAVERDPTGTTTWTAPTGHRYARPPEPALPTPPEPGRPPPPF